MQPWDVYTSGVRAAKMTSVAALINIMTGSSIPHESFVTLTTVRADSVIAGCKDTAIECVSLAFVDVLTRLSIPWNPSRQLHM